MPSLLSLDASKYVGWAYFSGPTAMPKCRTWVAAGGRWKSDSYAPYFVEFEDWLIDTIKVLSPDLFAFESPIVIARNGFGVDRGNDENNIRRLIGIVSIAEKVAHQKRIRCFEVNNSTAKSCAGVGHRRLEGETEAQYKDRMVVAMTNRGYDVADSHQADACAVGLVVYDMLSDA